jgi:hypothetical protein
LSDQPSLLVTGSVVNAALKDAAAMAMGSNINAMGANSIKDELSIGWGELVETLLNDMVSVQILNELNNSITKSIDDCLYLTGRGDEFDHLLQCSGTVLVESNANKVMRGVLNENSALLVVTVLKKLLAEVVAKWIGHQLNDMLVGLKPYHMNLLRVPLLKLLLQVPTSMLILAKGIDFTTKLLELHVGKSVHCYMTCQH